MSSTNSEPNVEEKDWEDWHTSAAEYSDRDGHVTEANTEPRAFNPNHYIDSLSDHAPPISCQVQECDRQFASVQAYNLHVTRSHYPDTIELDCGWCGTKLFRKPGQARTGAAVSFCDMSCAGKWHSHNNYNHPAFQMRRVFRRKPWPTAIRDAEIEAADKPSWVTYRAKLHENQQCCENCSRSSDEFVLHSHHLLPVLFGGSTFESNLMVLCSSCHRKAENYIGSKLDGHYRMPNTSDAVRIFQRESSRSETDCCIHCDNDTDGVVPIHNRPIIPVDAGGTPDLTYPVCNSCFDKHRVYLYRNVLDSSMLLFGKCPDSDKITYPDYAEGGLSMLIPEREKPDYTVYSDEELLDNLRQFADDIGRSPTQDDMTSDGPHSHTTYLERFGTWNEAVRAAGLEPFKEHTIPREALLDEIHRLYEKLGEPPTESEIQELGKWSVVPFRREFGRFSKAIEAAGYEPTPVIQYTDEEVLEELRRLKNEYGKVTTSLIKEQAVYSIRTFYNHFDSIQDAKNQAGV